MTDVLVRDETMAGREISSRVLPGLPELVTARELVRARVRGGFLEPFPAGVREADAACAAFGRNAFVMLVGDRQIEDLDEVIDLHGAPAVVFIRLVALVGG
jgi:hypothetical protein